MQFLPGSGRIDTAIWMHYMDSNKTGGKEARRQLHKNAASNLERTCVDVASSVGACPSSVGACGLAATPPLLEK